MIDPDVEREEEANAERHAEAEAPHYDHGFFGTIQRAFDAVLSPLTREQDSTADVEARRRASDEEERE